MSKTKKNIIMVDFDAKEDWAFRRAVEETSDLPWEIRRIVSNRDHGSLTKNLIRYIKYFLAPLGIALCRDEYNKILAWQQFHGLILAFYIRLMHIKNAPEIYVMTFIYKPKKKLGALYESFVRYAVGASCVKKIIVYSKAEKDHYSEIFKVPGDKFSCQLLGHKDNTAEVPSAEPEKYFLAAGRSNRDYDFLLKAWEKRNEALHIVCDNLDAKETDAVKILKDCYGQDFLRELARCYAVIIPLRDTHVSSGQLVLIKAMMYGKPVIVTENDTIRDYIEHGVNGLIIEKSESALFKAIEQVKEKEVYQKLSFTARQSYEEKFDLYAMGRSVGRLIANKER